MEGFIHRENLALFKRRLAEPCDDAQRRLLLKLLAEEEAKELPLEQANAAAVGSPQP